MSLTIGVTTTVSTESIDALILRMATIPAIIATFADLIEQEAKRLAPVKTGALRDEIHTVLSEMAADIISDMPYSAVQEYGGGHTPSHPFLRPATERYAAAFVAAIQAAVNG
jgi:HK97 gp10 family phage protein